MVGQQSVGPVPQALLPELVVALRPTAERAPPDVVMGRDLPHGPSRLADPSAAVKSDHEKVRDAIPHRGLC